MKLLPSNDEHDIDILWEGDDVRGSVLDLAHYWECAGDVHKFESVESETAVPIGTWVYMREEG